MFSNRGLEDLMYLTLKFNTAALKVIDPEAKRKEQIVIPAGRHRIKRIENPLHKNELPWLVLADSSTIIGKGENAWEDDILSNGVVIEE